MMISFYRIVIAILLVAIIAGCSSFRNKEPEYLASREGAPLKIPSGMDDPTGPSPVLISVPEMRLPAGDELEPAPPRVVSTAGRQDANAYIAWSAQGAYLMVKDTPDSVARRLGYAIVNSGMTMLETGASGSLKFHYKQAPPASGNEGFFSRMAFWRSRPDFVDFSGTFMTSLKPDGEDTRVYLLFGTGQAVDTSGSEHILGIFMERLG